jgi:uncharacterized membrane protein
MERLYDYISGSIIRGALLIIPIGIAFMIFEKLFHLLGELLIAFGLHLHETSFLRTFVNTLAIIVSILFICFIAGQVATLRWSEKLVAFLEKHLLTHIPGYSYVKSLAANFLGMPEHEFKNVILFRQGENLQLGFEVEALTAKRVAIFIPGVPKPRSGSLLIVNKDKIINTDLKVQEAFSILKGTGVGAKRLLNKCIVKSEYDS